MPLQPGQRIYNPHEQVYLVCTEGGHYILQTLDNLFFYFGEVPDTNSEVPLQRIENALGHFLHFTRTPDGTLTDISATGGTRVHLHYDNPLGRLTDIKRGEQPGGGNAHPVPLRRIWPAERGDQP